MIVFSIGLFLAVTGNTGTLMSQDDSTKAIPGADPASQSADLNNPENTMPTAQQQQTPETKYFGRKTDRPVSAHKVNYSSLTYWPGRTSPQIKFQISMKFRLLEPNLYVLKYNLFPAYIAYTQKSLWNVGQRSTPFEESNYNPEFFLDYPVNAGILGRLKLRSIVISPFEHESNGLVAAQSRSWNRQYVLVRFGLKSKEKLEVTNSFLADKALLYVKLWYASGCSDQDTYLESRGNHNTFMNYMGWGEIGLSIRDFLWGGILRAHQLDLRTPIFRDIHKHSYQFEFRQQLPFTNFALYWQYWYGYGETLMRFDQFGRRGFVGLSFSY
jgi:phospholipase A1